MKVLAGVPQTMAQLVSEGYELQTPNSHRSGCFCLGCFAELRWWKTPRGIYVPFEEERGGKVVLHYLRCPTLTPMCKERLIQYESEL